MMEEAKQSESQAERNQHLSLALCNSELLFNLINDILDFAQLKQKNLKLILQEVNLLEVVESVFSIMRIQTDMKGIALQFINKILPFDEIIQTDQRRLKQILINLIGNAMKFTTIGSIQLTLSKIKSFYKFEIQDTGTGIKHEIIPKLCQPFQTFGNEKFKNSSGVGLGLCFCKQLVGMLGPLQELFIDSIYGKGAKFGFLLENKTKSYLGGGVLSPKKNIQMDLSILSQNQMNTSQKYFDINEYFSEFIVESIPEIEEFGLSDKPELQITSYSRGDLVQSKKLNSLKKKQSSKPVLNILIVDDSPFNIIVLKQQLDKISNSNFNIIQGYNGQMAVEQFKQFNNKQSTENIKLIFMDCNMPIMDGYQASDEIKKLIQTENYIPVLIIALSAQILETNFLSFDYILTKPCPLKQLEKCLDKINMN